tara:strand:+ start:18386 stop:19018 length:633 start_codon:yes stop_codon:yes gene_type:complete
MNRRFAPDFDDEPTLDIPNFRVQAQRLLQICGGGMLHAQDYVEAMGECESMLKEMYQHGYENAKKRLAHAQIDAQKLSMAVEQSTLRPNKKISSGIDELDAIVERDSAPYVQKYSEETTAWSRPPEASDPDVEWESPVPGQKYLTPSIEDFSPNPVSGFAPTSPPPKAPSVFEDLEEVKEAVKNVRIPKPPQPPRGVPCGVFSRPKEDKD